MMNTRQSITKASIIVIIISAISSVLGFGRDVVVAAVFGVGVVTDAYAIAVQIVATAGLLVSVYLSQTFIPTYLRVKEKQGESEALAVANNALGLSLITNIVLMAAVQLARPLILNITGFNDEQISVTTIAVAIVALQLPIHTFVHFFTGYLTARKSFIGPNFIGIPMNIIIISACFIIGVSGGIVGLSLAGVLGAVAQCFIFLFWLPKEKYRYKFSAKFSPEIRRDIKILLPALAGSAIFELKAWIDTIISTHLGEGNTAAMTFAFRLPSFIMGLLVLPISGIIYAHMSEYSAQGNFEKMLDVFWRAVRSVIFILIPLVVIAIPASVDIIRIVYERGEFTVYDTFLTSTALMWYMPALFGLAFHALALRFFYSMQDAKTPMICSVISIAVNVPLSVWLSSIMGLGGLAMATSIASILLAILLLVCMRRRYKMFKFRETAMDIAKMGVCAVPCFLVAVGMMYLITGQHEVISFGVSVVAGGVAYIGAAFLLKEMVLIESIVALKNWLNKRRS